MHVHVYVWEHIVSLYYRTVWWMFTKLGRDEVLMAPHMHWGVSAISAQERIQGKVIIGHGRRGVAPSFSKIFLQTGRLQQQTQYLRNECLFFCVHGKMNLGEARDKSREPRSGSLKICYCLNQVHFPWTQKNKMLIPYIYNNKQQQTLYLQYLQIKNFFLQAPDKKLLKYSLK